MCVELEVVLHLVRLLVSSSSEGNSDDESNADVIERSVISYEFQP